MLLYLTATCLQQISISEAGVMSRLPSWKCVTKPSVICLKRFPLTSKKSNSSCVKLQGKQSNWLLLISNRLKSFIEPRLCGSDSILLLFIFREFRFRIAWIRLGTHVISLNDKSKKRSPSAHPPREMHSGMSCIWLWERSKDRRFCRVSNESGKVTSLLRLKSRVFKFLSFKIRASILCNTQLFIARLSRLDGNPFFIG